MFLLPTVSINKVLAITITSRSDTPKRKKRGTTKFTPRTPALKRNTLTQVKNSLTNAKIRNMDKRKIKRPKWAVPFDAGELTKRCEYCAALHFPNERERCCDKGKVFLPEPEPPLSPLDELLEGITPRARKHRQYLSLLNTLFSFASRQFVRKKVAGRGVPIRKIQGPYSHAVSGVEPEHNQARQFGSIYVLDERSAITEELLKNNLTSKIDKVVSQCFFLSL